MKKSSANEQSWEEIGKAVGKKIENESKEGNWKSWNIKGGMCGGGSGSAFYGLGFLGALYYYLTTATSFWMGIVGVLKAIVWPAFFVFEIMKFLKM